MKKGFINYTVNELLFNNSFLCWKLFSSEADRIYWEKIIMDNPPIKKEIDKADRILKNVRLNDYQLSSEKEDEILKLVQQRIARKRKSRKLHLYFSGAACACILVLGVFIAMQAERQIKKTPLLVADRCNVSDEKNIQLIFADNDVMVFEQDADITYQEGGSVIATSKGSQATSKKVETKEEVLPNELVVPKGKRTFLTLEDGTKVWVNSGTNIKFPSVFQADKREVYVEGEIYIEVAKDKDKPFYVNTSAMKVEVLGTRFNISAYKEDNCQSVVLVEGKVEVETQHKKTTLLPDMMLAMTNNAELRVQKVDVYNYISWKDGLLQFSSESLDRIFNKISRYYDVVIEYDEDVAAMACFGKLVLFENVADVMESIYNTIPVEYEIKGNRIRVQKR